MAVVGGVGRERLAAVFALEGLLPRVLPDVRAEYAGRRELLPGTESRESQLPPAGRPVKQRVSFPRYRGLGHPLVLQLTTLGR